jgi:predicted dehydrogenase
VSVHRFGVVGCGAIARGWHLPNLAANPRARVVVTCDVDGAAAEGCAQAFEAERTAADWREVVAASDVDAILLATHTNLRGALIGAAVRAGKPVFVEKPLASTREEALEISRAVGRSGVPVCVNHNRRSCPAILDGRRLLETARSGAGGFSPSVDRSDAGRRQRLAEEGQTQILIRVNDDARSWKEWVFADAGGIVLNELVHFVDLALVFERSRPTRVIGDGSIVGNFSASLRFEDGSLTTIHHALCGHFDYPKELIEIAANNVTIAIDNLVEVRQRGLADEPFRRTYAVERGGDWVSRPGIEGFHDAVTATFERSRKTGEAPAFIWPDKGHAAHLDRFLDCIEGTGENPCDVASAVVVTQVTSRLLEAVRSGSAVTIGPEDCEASAV